MKLKLFRPANYSRYLRWCLPLLMLQNTLRFLGQCERLLLEYRQVNQRQKTPSHRVLSYHFNARFCGKYLLPHPSLKKVFAQFRKKNLGFILTFSNFKLTVSIYTLILSSILDKFTFIIFQSETCYLCNLCYWSGKLLNCPTRFNVSTENICTILS